MTAGKFQTVPVEVVGQTYQHRSRPLSSQVTMNLIPEFQLTGQSQTALISWPGSVNFAQGVGTDRGVHNFNGVLYQVSGTVLQSIDSLGVRTGHGTIAGSNRCIFANDSSTLVITTGGTGYLFDGTTLSEITDPDFEQGNSVAFLNSQFIYDADGGKFQVSSVADPGDLPNNNFATAESSPDDTIRVFTYNEKLYLFGTQSTETWWNSGVGNPPFDRVQGGTMNIGLAAVHAVTATEDFVYWLGSDRSMYRASAYQAQDVTSLAIANTFEGYADVTDAIMYDITIDGQNFIILTFPTEGATFGFNEKSNGWFQLSTGANEARYIGNSYVEAYGKKLIADKDGGAIHSLDLDTYTDNGQVIRRQRVTQPITGGDFGVPGQRILMSRFQLMMETGVGLATGQGVDPQLMFEASFDGGRTWTNQDTVQIGRAGETTTKVEWYNLQSGYEVMIRITATDPVPVNIYSASMDVKPAGW